MLCGDPEGLAGYGWEEDAIGRGYMHAYVYTYTHKHIRITGSLHCIAETNTTLYSNYTPIKNTLGDGLEFLPKLYSNRQFSNHFSPCY